MSKKIKEIKIFLIVQQTRLLGDAVILLKVCGVCRGALASVFVSPHSGLSHVQVARKLTLSVNQHAVSRPNLSSVLTGV